MKTVFKKRKKRKKDGLAAHYLFFCFTRVLVSPGAWARKGLRNNRGKIPQVHQVIQTHTTSYSDIQPRSLGPGGLCPGFQRWFHGMVCVGRNLIGHLVPNTLPQTGTPSVWTGCSKPHPTCHFPSLRQVCVTPLEPSATRTSEHKQDMYQRILAANYLNKKHQT